MSKVEAEKVQAMAAALAEKSGGESVPLRDSETGWVPCQSTLPMGDGNAVCYGTLGHIGILKKAGLAKAGELVTYRGPVPTSLTWEGVVVDDTFG